MKYSREIICAIEDWNDSTTLHIEINGVNMKCVPANMVSFSLALASAKSNLRNKLRQARRPLLWEISQGTAVENSDFDKNTNSKHIVTYGTYIDGVTLSLC